MMTRESPARNSFILSFQSLNSGSANGGSCGYAVFYSFGGRNSSSSPHVLSAPAATFFLQLIREEVSMIDQRIDRLQIMLTSEELQLLDDWRFTHRMPSRSAAVRELLKRGLAAEGFVTHHSTARARSKDYGVAPPKGAKTESKGADGRADGASRSGNGNGHTSRQRS
jgi:hypothetical protein